VAEEFRASAGAWAAGEERTRASALLRAAGVLMVGREPGEAVAVAREVLPVLPGLRSQRVLADVRDLTAAAEPFRRRSDVDELVQDLAEATA
jgi:triphosphoribosyl-dephospho-CoA synthetase